MKKIGITRIEDSSRHQIEDYIISEISLKLVIHSSTPFVLPCSGDHVNEMITGYLYTTGRTAFNSKFLVNLSLARIIQE